MKGLIRSMAVIATTAFLCGCERADQEIKVYRVAKAPLDQTPPPDAWMPTNASSPSALPNTSLSNPTTADAPKNWEPQPLSQMRQASFVVRGENGAMADISFVVLGPAAGNVLDNVNRWLGQLKQPAVSEEKLKTMIQALSTPRGNVAVVDLSGQPENGDPTKDGRIVGAMAADENSMAFYKMRGNATLVGAEKENFLKWVSASRAAASSATTSETTSPPPPAASNDKPEIKWQVPAGWSPAPPAPMRYASFAAEKNGEKADISIVTFPGDGGNDVDNVNRWRQQIGLGAVQAADLKSMIADVHAGEVHIDTVDMAGASARVLAGWTRQGGRAWFFKMTGPPAVVEQEKPNFTAFLQSIRF
jgi:hypothetical protein